MLKRLIAQISEILRREIQVGEALPGLAADVGCSAAHLGVVGNVGPDVAERMGRMAAVFGADRAMALAERWRREDMVVNCAWCDERSACKTALSRKDLRPEAVTFCPNTENFHALTARYGIAN